MAATKRAVVRFEVVRGESGWLWTCPCGAEGRNNYDFRAFATTMRQHAESHDAVEPRFCDEPDCLRHDEHYHIAPDMRECGNVP